MANQLASTDTNYGFKLAKAVGILAIIASAVSQEYGAGINYVSVNSLSVYPRAEYLVPLAMFVTGILLFPKVGIFMRYSEEMPRAGSTYVWMSRSINLYLGFVVNFLWWVGVTAALGFLAFSFGTFLGQALISVGIPGGAWFMTPIGHIILGTVGLWLIFYLHASGVQNYGLFVSLLFGLIILTALVITIIGFATSPGHFVTMASSQVNASLKSLDIGPPTLGAFFSVCTLFVFAYGGLNAAPTLGGETRNAEKTMPRGIFFAWAVAVVLFTLVASALFHAAPWWAVIGLINLKHQSLATAPGLISVVAPSWLGATINIVVAIIVGKTMAPEMLASSRFIFAWAQDRMLPEKLANTSEKTKSPVNALILTTIVGTLFLIESSTAGWSIGVVIRSLSILLVLAVLAIGVLNCRYGSKFRNVEWAQRIGRGGWIIFLSIAAIIIAVVLFYSVGVSPKTPLVFQPLFQLVITWIIGTAIYYWAMNRARSGGYDLRTIERELPLE